MINVVLEIVKYSMLLLLMLYVCFDFLAIGRRTAESRKRLCSKMVFTTFLLHFLGYMSLYILEPDPQYLLMYAAQLGLILTYYLIFPRLYAGASRVIAVNTLTLMTIGFIELGRLAPERCWKQVLMSIPALIITIVIPFFVSRIKLLAKGGFLYAILGIGLLGLVLFRGNTTYGAQLSLSFAGVTLQPSEFVKITFLFFAASLLCRRRSKPWVIVISLFAGIHVLLLVASTDLGSGVVYYITYLIMLFASASQPLYLLVGAGLGAIGSVAAYFMFSHVRVRVLMWINPFSDYAEKGFQLAQSLLSISSGGWFGSGLGQGMPTLIPKVYNDFIFSAICEEMGAVFGIFLLLVYLGFVLQIFRVSLHMEDPFYKLLGTGAAAVIGVQTFLHVGGVIKMIPSTGITLPLISYGGSSLWSTCILIAVVQSLFILAYNKEKAPDSSENRNETLQEQEDGSTDPEKQPETGRRKQVRR